MMYVGVDPGSRCSGVAAVSGGRVLMVGAIAACDEEAECSCLPPALSNLVGAHGIEPFRFAVEGQEYRHQHAKGSPDGLFKVAHAAGAAFAALAVVPASESGEFVPPSGWKGTVPKLQHHRRLLRGLGWLWEETTGKEPYCVPTSMPPSAPHGYSCITKTQWLEVIDAIGIALWLEQKWERQGHA